MNNDSPRNSTVGNGFAPPASTTPAVGPSVKVRFNRPKIRVRFKHRAK